MPLFNDEEVGTIHIQELIGNFRVVKNISAMVPHLPSEFPNGADKASGPSLACVSQSAASKIGGLDRRPVFGNLAFQELVPSKRVLGLNCGSKVWWCDALNRDSIGHPRSGVGQDSPGDVLTGLQKSEPPVEIR
jgi:hypothetical protein